MLKEYLKWRAWKPHYCQALSAEDCNIHLEILEIMLAWYEDWPGLFQNILSSDEFFSYWWICEPPRLSLVGIRRSSNYLREISEST